MGKQPSVGQMLGAARVSEIEAFKRRGRYISMDSVSGFVTGCICECSGRIASGSTTVPTPAVSDSGAVLADVMSLSWTLAPDLESQHEID